MQHFFARLMLAFFMLSATFMTEAACRYSSVQIRIQPNTSTPWAQSLSLRVNNNIHIGVFKNGWGVPVDAGSVSVVAVNGASSVSLPLTNGWETWWTRNTAGTWSLRATCDGTYMEAATVTFTSSQIDVLSYVKPGGANGVAFSIITNRGNPWRTFSKNNGAINERLPGFYITKGNQHPVSQPTKAWNFEQMIYDDTWIWLVRDTSWTSKCTDTNREAGMLLLTNVNGQWVRGGRHFPRFIANGGSVSTGDKLIQGVRKKSSPTDNEPNEGKWCNAQYSGTTNSVVRADLVPSLTVGNHTFTNVLKLSITSGSGTGDAWWFAKGDGLVKFAGPGLAGEEYNSKADPYAMDVRIPCEPSAPCM